METLSDQALSLNIKLVQVWNGQVFEYVIVLQHRFQSMHDFYWYKVAAYVQKFKCPVFNRHCLKDCI